VPKPSAIAYDAGGPYLAESVVDGDTIRISCNGEATRVRLVDVDTPETVKEASPVECGGPGASAYVCSQLDGGQVFLSPEQRYERTETELFARIAGMGRELENRVTGDDSARLKDQREKTETGSTAAYGSAEHHEAFAASLAGTASEAQVAGRLAAARD
jgi:hypothetical protein